MTDPWVFDQEVPVCSNESMGAFEVSGRNRLKDQLQLKPALLFMVLGAARLQGTTRK